MKKKIKDETKAQTHTPSAMRHKITKEILEKHYLRTRATNRVYDTIEDTISKTAKAIFEDLEKAVVGNDVEAVIEAIKELRKKWCEE